MIHRIAYNGRDQYGEYVDVVAITCENRSEYNKLMKFLGDELSREG